MGNINATKKNSTISNNSQIKIIVVDLDPQFNHAVNHHFQQVLLNFPDAPIQIEVRCGKLCQNVCFYSSTNVLLGETKQAKQTSTSASTAIIFGGNSAGVPSGNAQKSIQSTFPEAFEEIQLAIKEQYGSKWDQARWSTGDVYHSRDHDLITNNGNKSTLCLISATVFPRDATSELENTRLIFCNALKRALTCNKTRIITHGLGVFTGHPNPEAFGEAMSLGLADFIADTFGDNANGVGSGGSSSCSSSCSNDKTGGGSSNSNDYKKTNSYNTDTNSNTNSSFHQIANTTNTTSKTTSKTTPNTTTNTTTNTTNTTTTTTNDTTNDTTASKTNQILLICRDCTKQFEFTIKEQETYKQNGWTNKPGRCLTCRSLRAAKKLKTNTNNNNSNSKLQIDSEESTDSKVQNKIPRSNATGTRMGVVVALTTPSPLNDSQHLPSPLQQIQHKFSYDIKTYQFNLLLYQMFQLAKLPDGGYLPDLIDANNFKQISCTLSQLHKTLEHFVGRTNSSPFHKAWKSIMSPSSPWKGFDGDCKFKSMENRQDLFHSFQQTLHQFVRTVVAKVLNCGPDDILYQRKPTLRVVVPSVKAVGHPHVDYDYHHQPGEINIWIPVTNVYGTNTLYSESKPGQKDFKPFVCNNGEAVSFWGNQCTHYTVPNETDVTRVSLDFRVIEKKRFNTNFVDSRGMETYFRVGEYYKDSAESIDGKEVDGVEKEEEMEFLGSLMHEST